MKKLIYLIAVIAILGLIVSGCIPVVPPSEQDEPELLPNKSPDLNVPTSYATIQAAINAATSPGEIIKVADGTYTITAAINVNKSVTIIGNITNPGNVLVKYSSAVTDKNCFDITADYVKVHGIKAINGKMGFYLNSVTGCKVSNCVVNFCADKGIYVRKCAATSTADRVEVTGNTISGCAQPCIQTYQSPYTRIYNNTISSTGDKGINIIGPNATSQAARVIVEGNTISGCPWDAILVTHDRYTYIYNNTISSCGDKGITIGNGENVSSSAERIVVEGNTVSGTKWPGIQVAWNIDYTYIHNNTVTGCNYYGSDETGDWDYASIHIDSGCENTVVDGNTVSDGINGIQIWSDNCTVTNNTIYDMGSSYANTKVTDDGTYYNSGIIIGNNWLTNNFEPTGITVEENTLTGNVVGLFIHYASNNEAHLNNIEGNTRYGVCNDTNTLFDAAFNWWGHASGPGGPDGRVNGKGKEIGKGDKVSANVDWDPWLPQPVDHTPHHPVPPGLLK